MYYNKMPGFKRWIVPRNKDGKQRSSVNSRGFFTKQFWWSIEGGRVNHITLDYHQATLCSLFSQFRIRWNQETSERSSLSDEQIWCLDEATNHNISLTHLLLSMLGWPNQHIEELFLWPISHRQIRVEVELASFFEWLPQSLKPETWNPLASLTEWSS